MKKLSSDDGISRPLAAFGTGPGNITVRVLHVAGLAVETVGRVELQLPVPGLFILDHFIDIARTKAGTGAFVGGIGDIGAQGQVMHDSYNFV